MQATAILVVEDELALRNAVMLALRAGGWNVLDAGSGEAAIVPAACLSKADQRALNCYPAHRCPEGWDVAVAVREKYPTARCLRGGQ
jgi:hypothetical protein